MKHPLRLALALGALVLLTLTALPFWQALQGKPQAASPAAEMGLPWQTRVGEDGSLQVFGLAVGRTRLAEAQDVLGDSLQVALVARVGEVGALEALADPFRAGFVSGRLVLAFEVPPAQLLRWREGAPRSVAMEGGVRRFELLPADREQARSALLSGLSFVPTARLSQEDVQLRFGMPARVLDPPGGGRALLYPERGLVASVAPDRKSVLQYVAPGDFEARLAAPLVAAAAASGAASAGR
ncbi:conserved hypothetical protein [Rubrivivax sp. A210]|uniref:hypothetical protein n=1 Tax=Rubrivivax sp. A210 TaxID=2772301 RepID=UPI0019189453|nr:hypothetical protein [Rubrivivax sp. A210]CAD5371337.1 conserved hypothetical protein [Rubrivivax sp. A210]